MGVSWRYIPPYSPSKNGLSEIMVKGVKRSLYTTFEGKHLTQTEFHTALSQAASQLNQRPLIATSDDADDNNLLCLTPNHVAKLQPLVSLPSEFDELPLDKLNKISIQTRWDARKKLHQKYMMMFQSEM